MSELKGEFILYFLDYINIFLFFSLPSVSRRASVFH